MHNVVVAAECSCHLKVGNPSVELRFFLRPKEEIRNIFYGRTSSHTVLLKWYSLCAEVLTEVNQNAAVKVTAVVYGVRKGNASKNLFQPNMFHSIINFVISF